MNFSSSDLAMFASGTEVYMAILNEKGIVVKANEKWHGKLGIGQDDFIGSEVFEFIHTNDRYHFKKSLVGLKSTKQKCHYLVQFVDSQLKSYTFQLDLTSNNSQIYLVGFDVTDHYKEHLTLQEMSAMAKVGAWYHDPIRNQNFWSDECYEIHDLEVGSPIDADKALSYYQPEYRDEIDKLIQRLYKYGEPYDFSGEIKTSKGNRKWIRTQAKPTMHDGKLIFIYGITADQSRLHQNQQKIEFERETRELALKGIKSGLFDYDIKKDLVFFSSEFKKMLGLPKKMERVTESEFEELIHPEDRKKAIETIKIQIKDPGNHYFNKYRVRHKNGKYRHYEVYGWKKKDAKGKTIRMVGNLIDVNERVLVQQERVRIMNSLEAMLDNGFIYSMLLDKKGHILLADQRTLDIIMHDYKVDPRSSNVKYVDVMPEIFKKTFRKEFSQALKGNTIRKEVERPLLDGSMQWLDVMYRPIRNDEKEIVFVLTNLMDVTERKKAELSTKEAETRASQLSDLKSKVLSDLSHEIRTPLNGIMGINEILTKDCLDADQKKLLKKQKESSIRLLKTLTDMILLSDQLTVNETLKPVHLDVNEVIQTCYDMYVHMANLKKLNFEIQLPKTSPKIFVDKDLFTASLGAIVNNSLKYTDKGRVVIDCKRHKKKGNITISVTDTGKGIHAKDFGKIFNSTNEGFGLHKKFEESGIQLGASKRYIESMGGTIRVVSSLDKGSEFIITMPSET
ncbi:MAG: PAS domain-containing protein [Cyclobacteriaceae bacterium]